MGLFLLSKTNLTNDAETRSMVENVSCHIHDVVNFGAITYKCSKLRNCWCLLYGLCVSIQLCSGKPDTFNQ